MNVINVNDFDFKDYPKFTKLTAPKGKKVKRYYVDNVSAFDIEVTNLKEKEIGIMYIWQFALDESTVIIGRYWRDFQEFIEKLKEWLPEGLSLVILVHNLSYEWQFLKSVIPVTDIFAMSNRKILTFNSDNLEFRCTYLHSNMDLNHYLQSMNVQHKKLTLDYSKYRYPWTELTKEELDYCINDVVGLIEAYKYENKKEGDTVYTTPKTSTGYVRRDVRKVVGGYIHLLRDWLPEYEVLKGLNLSFRGGNTHGNRKYAGVTIYDAFGVDIASAYPYALLFFTYPTRFVKGKVSEIDNYLKHDRAVLLHIHFKDLKLKDPNWGIPYLSRGKALSTSNIKLDNGRILSGSAEFWINEIDLQIINMEYSYSEVYIEECYQAPKRKLPYTLRKLIIDMFKQKTLLKGGAEGSDQEYFYFRYKNKINALFGMFCMSPLKSRFMFNPETNSVEADESITYEEIYKKYIAHGWLPYQIGTYCTSYARLLLERGLQSIPADDFLYADTDSIKFKNDHRGVFDKINKDIMNDKYSAVDKKGNKHYLGIFEYEGHYKAFRHLGAKRYAYIDDNDKLHVTISGVNKKKGAEELKTLDNLKENFTFYDAGRTSAKYNDDKPYNTVIDGRLMTIHSNIYLEEVPYTIGLSEDYREVIHYLMDHNIAHSLYYDYDSDILK